MCTGVGGDDCACGTCQGVWTQQPVAAPLGEGYWVANRALRGLAVGGNRMGDEGAAALAEAKGFAEAHGNPYRVAEVSAAIDELEAAKARSET